MAQVIEARIGDDPRGLTQALEDGGLILLPQTPFEILQDEKPLMDPAIFSGGSKNVSYAPDSGHLGGTCLEGEALERCRAMVARYATFARTLLQQVAPSYLATAEQRRTSFRPGEVSSRALSPRKDDRLLHVDAFPDREFLGVVDSFSAGTGARFSLLPPDNASGNFTKVVQRIPVRIRLEAIPADVVLRPGLSVEATVDVRRAP